MPPVSGLPVIFVGILGPVVVLVAIGVGVGRWLGLQPELLAEADETATIVMAGTIASVLTLPWFIVDVT